jgi:hypothetical protein
MCPRHHRAHCLAIDLAAAPFRHIAAIEMRDDNGIKRTGEPERSFSVHLINKIADLLPRASLGTAHRIALL